MLHISDGAMLSRLLGLLVLSSFCSARMPYHGSGEDESNDQSSEGPRTRSGLPTWPFGDTVSDSAEGPELPSGLFTWPHGDNLTDDGMRMLAAGGPGMPLLPDPEICEMMLNSGIPMDQIPIVCLCMHCKGTMGPKGDRGDRGPRGVPGSPGLRGMTGLKGRPGFTGRPGMKGQKGDLGEKGQAGAVGFSGMKGERGFKGEKGDRGLDGPAGTQGPQGETGTCPASCESVQGPPGVQGTPGPAGARGLPGVMGTMGTKGVKGDLGDMGSPGDPGMSGQKGDKGEEGVCECTDGTDGMDGQKGEMGAMGEKGDAGAKGEQGSMGPKGDMGEMGMMGQPGPCSPVIQSSFSAVINESFPEPNRPVAFSRVLNNRQGNFNPVRGIYTAPVNGTYVFTFNLAVADKILKVGLFLNRRPIVKVTESISHSTTSQTIVLHLKMGDRVWLQVKDSLTNGMYTGRESTSSFSGYLLQPDSCDMLPGIRNGFMSEPDYTGDYGTWDEYESTPSP
ncbi:uncharacterized protein [Pagrus major]|uniref:uncharacterized protein isoform X2 n=1 Tax=Pagrus major TaxID=143350 RepID=UPI003CC8E096